MCKVFGTPLAFLEANEIVMKSIHKIPTELEHFRKFIEQDEKLTVVAFTAETSGGSLLMRSMLRYIEEKYEGRLNFVHLDAEVAEDFIATYQVCQIPTLLFFARGEMLDCMPGLHSRYELTDRIDRWLAT